MGPEDVPQEPERKGPPRLDKRKLESDEPPSEEDRAALARQERELLRSSREAPKGPSSSGDAIAVGKNPKETAYLRRQIESEREKPLRTGKEIDEATAAYLEEIGVKAPKKKLEPPKTGFMDKLLRLIRGPKQ